MAMKSHIASHNGMWVVRGKRWKHNFIKAAEGLVEGNVLMHACVSS